jgi:predicted ribosomally synthesized peptide with nif11-like leader
MSKAHAKKFIKQLQKDPDLRKKVNTASQHIVKVAKAHGFDVTHEEISHSLKEHWSKAKPEDEPLIVLSETPGF